MIVNSEKFPLDVWNFCYVSLDEWNSNIFLDTHFICKNSYEQCRKVGGIDILILRSQVMKSVYLLKTQNLFLCSSMAI